MKNSLPLFADDEQAVAIPLYSIRLVQESHVYYNNKTVQSSSMVCGILKEIGLHEKASEEFHVLYLNTKHQVIGIEMVSRGTLKASLIHAREVFKGALLANAHALIVAHNHPSGNVDPSSADRAVTEALVKAGKLMDLRILDHVIIGSGGEYFSFKDSTSIIES